MAQTTDGEQNAEGNEMIGEIVAAYPDHVPSLPKYFQTIDVTVTENLGISFEGGDAAFSREDGVSEETVTTLDIIDFGGGAIRLECVFDRTPPTGEDGLKLAIVKGTKEIASAGSFELSID